MRLSPRNEIILSLFFDGMNHGASLIFSDSEYQNKRRQTRKEKLPELMMSVIEPYYLNLGNGRRPYPMMTMLRTHCILQWCSISDPEREDTLYDSSILEQG